MKLFCIAFWSLLVFTVCLLSSTSVNAQDARFSQYYSAPLRVNPAMTGLINGNWRVGLNYRNQYSAILQGTDMSGVGSAVTTNPYQTYAFTADGRLLLQNGDYVGLGFNALTDKAGTPGYTQTELSIGGSYMKKLSQSSRYSRYGKKESFLIAGAQLGIGQRSVDWGALTYPNQYDSLLYFTYNPNAVSGEPMVGTNAGNLYPDINLGVMWYSLFGKRKSAYAGLGVYHINMPNISMSRGSFLNVDSIRVAHYDTLYTRFSINAGGEILLGPSTGNALSLIPGMIAQFQGPSMEVNAGISLKYQKPKYDDMAFKIGLWSRFTNRVAFSGNTNQSRISPDALIVMAGLDYKTLQFGLSYDITISEYLGGVVNNRGGFEFSLIYTNDGNQKRPDGCPTF